MKLEIETLRADRHKLAETAASALGGRHRLLAMVASDEKEIGVDRFVLRYFFAAGEPGRVLALETTAPESDPTYASLTTLFPAAAWSEREAFDLFGVRPAGHPDLRPLVLHEDFPEGVHPLRKDYRHDRVEPRVPRRAFTFPKVEGDGVFEIPVGPIHAGIIEPGHFRFQVMGDTVLHLEAKLFYTHRGLEKRAEGMDVGEGVRLAEQICGVCAVSHALSYAQAVEGIAGLEVPPRALYLRSLFAELERLYNHVGDIANICAGVGFAYGSNHGARWKEALMQLNARVAGHRYLRGAVVPGGAARDVADRQLDDIARTVAEVRDNIGQIVHDALGNPIVHDRFKKTGVLWKDIAVKFGAVGPAARASKIDMDASRDFPHAAYPHLSFEVPVLEDGDVLARFVIRAL